MTVYVVTGLGYGDEGKGTTVDYLASTGKSLVVRHNGGPQAGHNVVLPTGEHHEFSQWGSGHFQGADTLLSKHMLVMPGDMRNESVDLTWHGDPWERMYVDRDAKIITPYHVAFNRLQNYAHGQSCGRGVGETMRQHLARRDLTIHVRDIEHEVRFPGSLDVKLELLRDYLVVNARRMGLGRHFNSDEYQMLLKGYNHAGGHNSLANDYADWARDLVTIVDGREFLMLALRLENYDHVIFEGAQGVLLDEWYGFHPYTTWSTTTHANALSLLDEAGWGGQVRRLGITRAYATRHGDGPFVTEDAGVNYDEPHNNTGVFQGAFRQGNLDLVALRYAIDVCGGVDDLVVTHLDRSTSWLMASAYATHDFRADAMIKPKDYRNLTRMAKRTQMLKQAAPIYLTAQVTTRGLLACLNTIRPVFLESWGPTCDDKITPDQH